MGLSCVGYLGSEDQAAWRIYDATELMISSSGNGSAGRAYDDMLIDVGTADSFLKAGQLLPEVAALADRM